MIDQTDRKLSSTWIVTHLHEIASLVRGVSYKKEHASESDFPEGLPILRATNITGSALTFDRPVYVPASYISEDQLLQVGDIVIAASSGSKEIVGKAGQFFRSDWKGSFGAFCSVIRPDRQLDARYLGFYFQSPDYRKTISDLSAGSNINNLKSSELAAHLIPVAPIQEQTRIVEKLEELFSDLDAGVAELKAAQKKLAQYRQSLLKAAVEGALTAEWRTRRAAQGSPVETGAQLLTRILAERRRRWEEKQLGKFAEQGKTPPQDWQAKYPEPVKPDTSDLPELPEGWTWTRIGNAGDVQLGRQRAPQYHTGANMVPYLRVANVFEDRIDVSDVMEMHFSPEEEENFKLSYDDILLNEGQSLELVGRSAIFRDELPRVCFTNTLVRFRAEDGVQPEYAQTLFLHYLHSGRFRKVATITTNIAHLGAGRLAEIEFPMPGAEEQQIIVAILKEELERIQQLQGATKISLRQSEAQRKNILKAAFSGQLVTQDPNDEPASVLLERIRAAREERALQPKPRKAKVSKQEVQILMKKLVDVLAEAGDWITAEEAFLRCGVADGTSTERIEELYAELRELVKAEPKRLDVARKGNSDRLKLIAKAA